MAFPSAAAPPKQPPLLFPACHGDKRCQSHADASSCCLGLGATAARRFAAEAARTAKAASCELLANWEANRSEDRQEQVPVFRSSTSGGEEKAEEEQEDDQSVPRRSAHPSAPADLLTRPLSDLKVNPHLWLSVFCANVLRCFVNTKSSRFAWSSAFVFEFCVLVDR